MAFNFGLSHLDGGYTVFGRVNETDMKVVDNLVRGDKILSVKIVEGNAPPKIVRPKGEMIETAANSKRFSDNGEQIYDFGDEFLVVCPKCAAMAKVLPVNESEILKTRKLICSNCGHSKATNIGKSSRRTASVEFSRDGNSESYIVIGGAFDWYFREPLWLQIECCGETLWAYNKKHLEFIENYVAAKIRARTPNTNKSLASRLPQWIKAAKNRDEVLKAIGNLKNKLNGKS